MGNTRLIERAITILQRGDPLPLDLFAKLLESGVDVDELARLYAA